MFPSKIIFRQNRAKEKGSAPMFLSFILFCRFPFKTPTMSNEWADINSTVEGYREEKHFCFLQSTQTDCLASVLKIISEG